VPEMSVSLVARQHSIAPNHIIIGPRAAPRGFSVSSQRKLSFSLVESGSKSADIAGSSKDLSQEIAQAGMWFIQFSGWLLSDCSATLPAYLRRRSGPALRLNRSAPEIDLDH
jgi:hypothetical protein